MLLINVGDDGLSTRGLWYEDSNDDTEDDVGYRKCPRVEKVGVTGDGISDGDESCV